MHSIHLSLGSNQGSSYETLDKAVQLLYERVGSISKVSPIYKSEAWGFEARDFLNCVVKMGTALSPQKLLQATQRIENLLGREKTQTAEQYQSRVIDIDILLYDNIKLKTEALEIPHKHMLARKFVLQPLVDIEGESLCIPYNKSFKSLLTVCADTSILVKQAKWLKKPQDAVKLAAYNYIAIEGNIGAGKTSLASLISHEFNAKLILERYKDNPFLPKFYKKPDRYAFPLEMSFLADRYQQLLDDLGQYDLFTDFVCADYDRYKSLIFAQVTLQKEEYTLYKRLHEMMYKEMPQPDLYVYLYQNTERLLKNIEKRGRSYEKNIEPEYLDNINKGYLVFIKNQQHLNVKIIDISELDFVNKREDFLNIIRTLTNNK